MKILKKKIKKRGGVRCPLLLLRKETLGCQIVDKHTDSPDLKYKKLFYDLCNLFVDNSDLSPERKDSVRDNLKKHIKSIKPCNNYSYNFTVIINRFTVNIKINFYRNCRVLLLIDYNASIHFTMFSDLNESRGYNGCCSPFHLTINHPKTRAYINFEYSENLDSLADAIEGTGYYIKTGKTRKTDKPVSDSWAQILRNIDTHGATDRSTFQEFCYHLRDFIKNSRVSYDFHIVRNDRPSSDRRARSRDRSPSDRLGRSRDRPSSDRLGRSRDRPSSDRRARSRDRSPSDRLGRSRDRPPSDRLGRSRDRPPPSDSGYNRGYIPDYSRYPPDVNPTGFSHRSRSPLPRGHIGGGNLLNKKIIDSINKYFDKIKKIKQEIKILKKKKNKKKIEAKKTTIKNTLVKIKLKKEKLKKLKQKQKK
jgi:hypothetical protein